MDIYLAEIPESNGHEQSGFRPVIVYNKPNSNISIVIPFTSNILALRFKYTFQVEPSLENGLTANSILLLFQMRALDNTRLKKKLGSISLEFEENIKKNLKEMLQL